MNGSVIKIYKIIYAHTAKKKNKKQRLRIQRRCKSKIHLTSQPPVKHGIAKSAGMGNSPGEKAFPRIYTGPNRQESLCLRGTVNTKQRPSNIIAEHQIVFINPPKLQIYAV